jgi:MFS family permease
LRRPAQGYLVSGASLGAAVGAILAGPAADRFGRKTLLIADAGSYIVALVIFSVFPGSAASTKTLGTGDLSDDDIQRAAEIVEQVEGGST